MSKYLTITDLSKTLKISESTLYRLRRKGIGPAFFRIGRAIRYRAEDVENWTIKLSRTSNGRNKKPLFRKSEDPLAGLF